MQNAEQILQKGWSKSQVIEWRNAIVAGGKKRDYSELVARLMRLPANTHIIEKYGTTSEGHQLLRVTVGDLRNGKPNILLTGGVHGNEPSGTAAIMHFIENIAPKLTNEFNIVAYPNLCPGPYEYDQRWSKEAEDPNRLFTHQSQTADPDVFRTFDIEESRRFMNSIESLGVTFACAIDLHETIDRDIDLRIQRAERFKQGLDPDYKEIPQGYYLILSKRPTPGENGRQLIFGQAIIDEVRKVSPIAPEEKILNGTTNFGGVILSPPKEGLLRTFLDKHARLVAVTEVYPDHPDMTPEKAVLAQLASIDSALNYVRSLHY